MRANRLLGAVPLRNARGHNQRSVLAVDESSLAVNAAHELCGSVPGVRVERYWSLRYTPKRSGGSSSA